MIIKKTNPKKTFAIRKRFRFLKTFKIIKTHSILSKFVRDIGKKNIHLSSFLLLAVFLTLLFLGVYEILNIFSTHPPIIKPRIVHENMSFDYTLSSLGIATYGGASNNLHNAYFIYKVNLSNVSYSKAMVYTYKTAPREVYLLDGPREDFANYDEVVFHLKQNLNKLGFVYKDVSFGDIETIPKGSLLLVLSGRPYYRFFEPGPGNITSLLERGIYIIYVGNDFSVVLNEKGEKISLPSKKLSSLPFTFSHRSKKISNLSIRSGLYSVNPSYPIYHGISVFGTKGRLVFVPRTLDTLVWKNSSLAAKDISKIIYDMYWLTPETNISFNIKNGTNFIYSLPFNSTKEDIVIKFFVGNNYSNISKLQIFSLYKEYPGDLYIAGGIEHPSYKMSGNEINLISDFKNLSKLRKYIYLRVYDIYGNRIISTPIRNEKIQLIGSVPYDFTPDLQPGYYILKIEDRQGIVYGRSMLIISNISFVPKAYDFSKGKFIFGIYSNGKPTTINQKISVIVDNDPDTKKEFFGAKKIVLEYPEKSFLKGKHTFTFKIRDEVVSVVLERRVHETIFSNPLAWLAIFGVLVLIAITSYIATHREPLFYLDIPDLPPIESSTAVVKVSRVLKLFEDINKEYRWKYMPLKFNEIKKGFSKIMYDSKPIYISDYNLSLLLLDLERKGYIKSYLDYYGLTSWEKRFSVPYLAMFRKVRDICISRIVPFSNLGKEKLADMKLSLELQNIYLHFAVDKSLFNYAANRAIKTINKGLSIILTPDEATKNEFLEMLNSNNEDVIVLKLFILAGFISLLTIDELDKRLKEFKD